MKRLASFMALNSATQWPTWDPGPVYCLIQHAYWELAAGRGSLKPMSISDSPSYVTRERSHWALATSGTLRGRWAALIGVALRQLLHGGHSTLGILVCLSDRKAPLRPETKASLPRSAQIILLAFTVHCHQCRQYEPMQ